MLKRLMFCLFLTFFATPAAAQVSAAEFAESVQSMVGKDSGPIGIASIKAEGSVVVVVLDASDWEGARESATDSVLLGFCESGDESGFFTNKQLRVDTLEKGRGLIVGRVVNKCPEETGG